MALPLSCMMKKAADFVDDRAMHATFDRRTTVSQIHA
jgi:hypothetical protein